jgi:DnaK suppressor protein
MNINNVDYLKSMLVRDLHNLRLSAQKTSTEMKTDEKLFSDFYDLATVEAGRSVDLIIRSREREMIRDIEEALTRIKRGEFGICQDCGKAISEKRLRAEPTSLLCIKCKEKEECGQRGRTFTTPAYVSFHPYPAW